LTVTLKRPCVGQNVFAVYAALKFYVRSLLKIDESTAARQANRWFVLMLSDCVTQQDHKKFKQWLSADCEHCAHYHQLNELWAVVACYTEKSEVRRACEKAYRSND
jgi:ferric-dicitrate binding protein FerR (iron transport regulator)